MIDMLMGIKVITSEVMVKKIAERRHRCKRINRKWVKKYGVKFKEIPDLNILRDIYNNCLYMHPKTLEKIKRRI